MEIRDLSQTSPASIFETFQEAFSDYFLPMNENFEENLERWESAGVDLKYSYGAFYEDQLVGFVLHTIQNNGLVFNFSTGVVPQMRGVRIVDEIYSQALPRLKAAGMKKVRLEVLAQNSRAQNLYARLGFTPVRRLHCFTGRLPSRFDDMHQLRYHVKEVHFTPEMRELVRLPWSTEHSEEVILRARGRYELHELREDHRLMAYAVFHPQGLRLMQLEARPPFSYYAKVLLGRMKLAGEDVRMFNVDERNTPLLEFLNELGLTVQVDQWEMELEL